MARLPRMYVPGWPTHLVVRGNDRQDIFRTEGDRVFFHRCLVETTRRHGVGVHAYVFMTNHVHLLATGYGPHSIAATIQSMGRRYVSYFNYLHDRTGTLWEGRYRSCLVETDRYLLACSRYIEMNPVRAGLAAVPGEFPWSSFRFNARGGADDLVTPHATYLGMARSQPDRLAAYRALFTDPTSASELEAIRAALNTGWGLGCEAFCRQAEETTGRRSAPRSRGRPKKCELAKLESDPIY